VDAEIRLLRCDEVGALAAIARLRDTGRADSIAARLERAVRRRSISEDVLVQHSRWCHTGGSWGAGVDAAREAAKAMYQFVPRRLVDEEGKPYEYTTATLEAYRRQLEDG
jgi:hypothetical protein